GFAPGRNAPRKREGHSLAAFDRETNAFLKRVMSFLGDTHSFTAANARTHFTCGVKRGAEAIVSRRHPKTAAEVGPALRVIVLAAARAERIHQQERPPIVNAWRVIFRITQHHVRRSQ